ncbi:hypothetical protein E0J16_25630 [Rhizobium pisi]|nr:hypothetical protein E0J16_25630 [Rhizobium pisi]
MQRKAAAGKAEARRDLSDSLAALQLFGFPHVAIAKPLRSFARHTKGRLSRGVRWYNRWKSPASP